MMLNHQRVSILSRRGKDPKMHRGGGGCESNMENTYLRSTGNGSVDPTGTKNESTRLTKNVLWPKFAAKVGWMLMLFNEDWSL